MYILEKTATGGWKLRDLTFSEVFKSSRKREQMYFYGHDVKMDEQEFLKSSLGCTQIVDKNALAKDFGFKKSNLKNVTYRMTLHALEKERAQALFCTPAGLKRSDFFKNENKETYTFLVDYAAMDAYATLFVGKLMRHLFGQDTLGDYSKFCDQFCFICWEEMNDDWLNHLQKVHGKVPGRDFCAKCGQATEKDVRWQYSHHCK